MPNYCDIIWMVPIVHTVLIYWPNHLDTDHLFMISCATYMTYWHPFNLIGQMGPFKCNRINKSIT